MSIAHMTRDTAKRHLQSLWYDRTSKYGLSNTDSFTDGFWDGRLWAAARLLEAFPELDRDVVLQKLEIGERESQAL